MINVIFVGGTGDIRMMVVVGEVKRGDDDSDNVYALSRCGA